MDTGLLLTTQFDRDDHSMLCQALMVINTLLLQPLESAQSLALHADHDRLLTSLQALLSRRGAIELDVASSGALSLQNTQVLPPDHDLSGRHLGEILTRNGVEAFLFPHDLNALSLSRFIYHLSYHAQRAPDSEHDLVTLWAEETPAGVCFTRTRIPDSLITTSISSRLPALVEIDLFDALRSMRTSSKELRRFRLPLLQAPRLAKLPDRPLDASARHTLNMILGSVEKETLPKIRNQFINSLFAVMGAREPALSPLEIAFLFTKVITQQINDLEFKPITQTIAHLESFLEHTAQVQARTREVASAILDRLRSPRMLRVLIDALQRAQRFQAPPKFSSWLLLTDPTRMWAQNIEQISRDDLPFLIMIFQHCFNINHPFWQEVRKSSSIERFDVIVGIISQLGHTEGFSLDLISLPSASSPGFTSPRTGVSRPPMPIQLQESDLQVAKSSHPSYPSRPSAPSHPSNPLLHEPSKPVNAFIPEPSKVIPLTAEPKDDIPDNWDDFDLESLSVDDEMAHLDDDMVAFLDAGFDEEGESFDEMVEDSMNGSTGVPRDMLQSLDELEDSLPPHDRFEGPPLGGHEDE